MIHFEMSSHTQARERTGITGRELWPGVLLSFSIAAAGVLGALAPGIGPAFADSPGYLERFDGSFRLETGEVLTGGYMVEGAKGRWVYLDTVNLEKGGLFQLAGDATLRTMGMLEEEGVEIEFKTDDGNYNTMIWRRPGEDSIRGRRVFPHASTTVSFASGDGTELHGRLLTPECPGPHPLVVSVHGSGPVNRYGGTFHTYFMKHGVAVLAYDKRGYTDDPEAWSEPDYAELSADAAAAMRHAASLDGIDDDRIGFFGSSQAGWVVPPAAVDATETDFQILRVGAALTPAETNLHEVRQELREEGFSGLGLDHAMALRREIYALATAGAPLAATDRLVAPYLDEPWYRKAFGEKSISESWSDEWWAWAVRNNSKASAPYLEHFDGPVLWFLAEQDENVPLVSTRAALERAFEAAPGEDHEIVVIENAPHSFIVTDEQGYPRYADGFFDYMAEWMAERGITDPGCWEG